MKVLTLSVEQFNNYVKNILDAEDFLSNIAIFGEVTNFKMSGANAYFDLKDSSAMLSCVKFGADDLNIKNGDLITVYGKVNFYVKSGRLNFIVGRAVQTGLGDLYQKFLELKNKLEKEGYFREEIKKPICRFAGKIGVVTSETGAVIRDIIHVTKSKNPYTDIVVFPSKVQGANAEDDIVAGINYFNTRSDIDTIIVARGGGSMEDLAPFNTEKVVLAIYRSTIPVISAVGHETDFTLCDFAADLRVPTPSVAAEVAVFDYFEQVENIRAISENNYYYITKLLNFDKTQTGFGINQILDKLKLKISENKAVLIKSQSDIEKSALKIFDRKSGEANSLIGVLSKLNPLEILRSGYSVVESGGKRISSAKQVKPGEDITITQTDGKINATVKSVQIGG